MRPCLQNQHCPQLYWLRFSGVKLPVKEVSTEMERTYAIWKLATTRSPFFTVLTSLPTSSTTPIHSCPKISPCYNCIISAWYRCRSLPQTVVPVALQITSVDSVIAGRGTSSTRTLLLPYPRSASVVSLGRWLGLCVVAVGRSPSFDSIVLARKLFMIDAV